jgi:hypothetical protein
MEGKPARTKGDAPDSFEKERPKRRKAEDVPIVQTLTRLPLLAGPPLAASRSRPSARDVAPLFSPVS